MTDAEKAYAAAERLIEQAKDEGWEALSFDEAAFRALEVLPDSLSDLTNLAMLDLDGTLVSDVRPLRALTNLTRLYLSATRVTIVTPLRWLTKLKTLDLRYTQVKDIAPLQRLTNLTRLYLNNTQVEDLRPIVGLTKLMSEPVSFGLWFRDTRATQIDPKIALISEIHDSATRSQTLFDYLQDWQPPDEDETPTQPKQRKSGASYRIDGDGKVHNDG
ncbi:MAG: leucine-rich repeat domain-containing protein, partial [Pseudomonadota bacterium]|nr:leucine-rich repeat domain-containing protein [Pseudomonadota bacterium]